MNDTRQPWAIGLALMGACSALHAADVTLSTCALVDLKSAHPLRQTGKNPFMTTQRLALIENGTVGCAHRETFETARCTFNVQQDARGEAGAAGPLAAHSGASGHWVEDAKGRRYAVAGQAIALNGARGGRTSSRRPATIGIPTPGRVNPKTPIVWRPVTSVRVAN